ncbi:REP-associated tyrosine transposase [Thiobaca trueperi]|uniref:REP element-mobilizing transposase RayT n=1 Tax=Thiobaca trueperi TaxID=127458 RepID=A0A4R3N040_9GAMM|nr:transposase [Thiobaca trueperi]TCT22105.1 REP element-mobilizing transposase RayT [Thiobaca trueperi]
MPRDDLLKGRFSCSGHVYHVTTCTEARVPLFRDFSCGRLVVKEMRELNDAKTVTSLAWVIMPDHVHWLFQLGSDLTLSQTMKGFKARSALTINRFLNRREPVWQRAFHDHALRREEDLRTVARYIIGNPLRAGLVQYIGDYPLWDAIWL